MYFPSTPFLHRCPFFFFSCLRRTWWDGVNEDVRRGRVKGEPENPGSPGRMVVKPVCRVVD